MVAFGALVYLAFALGDDAYGVELTRIGETEAPAPPAIDIEALLGSVRGAEALQVSTPGEVSTATKSDAQPRVRFLSSMRSTIATMIPATAIQIARNPVHIASFNGTSENEMIPSIANETIFVSGYLLSPA